MDLTRPETDPVRDWEPRSSLDKARRFRDRGLRGPVVESAHETRDLLDEWAHEGWRPDVVVADILFYGTFTAAEHAGIPAVALATSRTRCPSEARRHWAAGWANGDGDQRSPLRMRRNLNPPGSVSDRARSNP
jgi:hypothetical protein